MGFSLAAFVSTVALSAWARAEPATSRLQTSTVTWTAPATCPSEQDLRRGIDALLGETTTLESSRETWITATARVDPEPAGGFVLALSIRSATGENSRAFRGTNCEALAQVAQVVIAIAIDPTISVPDLPDLDPGAALADAPSGIGRPYRGPTAAQAPPSHDALAIPKGQVFAPFEQGRGKRFASPGSDRARVALRFFAGAGYGVARQFGPSVGLGVSWLGRFSRVDLFGMYGPDRELRHERIPGVGVEVRHGAALLRGCGVPALRWVEFPLCAGLELGGVRGRAQGVAVSKARTTFWAALDLSAGTLFPLSRQVAIGVETVLQVPITRNRFTVDQKGSEVGVYRASRAGFLGFFVLEGRFP